MALRRMVMVAAVVALVAVISPAGAEETFREAHIEATVPRYGNAMAVGFGSIWIGSDKLARVNLGDNSITDIPIKGYSAWTLGGIAAGEGAVWVTNNTAIYKIDPQKNQVVMEIPAELTPSAGNIAVGEKSVWAISGRSANVLKRYSADSGREEESIALPSASSGILVAFNSVWITGTGNDELYRLDPTTNQIVATIELRSHPRLLAAGEGSVWVINGDGSVQRIDGTSNRLVATIETGVAGKSAIDVGGSFVWVNTNSAPIIQIDPSTNSVRGKFTVEMHEYSTIRYGGGSLWISGASVRRIRLPE